MTALQPTLTGKTVTIRPLQTSDWPELFAAAADPLIWALHPSHDRYKEPVFRAYFDGAMASKGAFAFVDRASGAIIGSSRYHGFDPTAREVEIGWTFLTRAYWGGQTNAEIKRLMIDHAHTFADTVVFWVGQSNWRSQRAMEKIGGVRRPGTFTREISRSVSGALEPHVIFEIKKP